MSLTHQINNKMHTEKTSHFLGVFKNIINKKKDLQINEDFNEEIEIIECLRKARNDWSNACLDFEYAQDEALIDFHTYRIKAYQLRYEFFLKKAKEKGLKVNVVDEDTLSPITHN